MKRFLLNILLLLFSFPLISQTLPSWVPKNGLAAFWSMSGNADDASGNGNHGVVHGATLIADRFGIENSAFSFDGQGNYIDVMDSPSLNPTAALTLSMWVQTTTEHGVAGVIGKWNNYGGIVGINREQFCFDVSDTNFGISFTVKTTDNFKVSPHEDTLLYRNGEWNHFVGSYDGKNARLYVNGRMVSSYRTSGPVQVYQQNFEIGRIAGGQPTCATAFHFTGNIDDVGLWNRALTEQEIAALFSGCPGLDATITPLGPTGFCQGDSVILKTSFTEGASIEWLHNDTPVAGASDTLFTATLPGKYSVVQTLGECRNFSKEIEVTVSPPPEAVITASGPLSFCSGGKVVLKASGGNSYLWSTGSKIDSITVIAGGTYSVVVKSGSCSAEVSVNVDVHPLPQVKILSPEGFIDFHREPVALSAEPSGGVFTGKGVDDTHFLPSVAGLGKTILAYTFDSPEGCRGVALKEVVVFDTTGVVCTAHDTLLVTVMDTIQVTLHDTIRVTLPDTIRVTINDTLRVTINDTLRVTINDTLRVTIHDTITVTRFDTLTVMVSRVIPDTLLITSHITYNGELVSQTLITIYPNPAKTYLNIRLSDYALKEDYALVIRNVLGQQMFISSSGLPEQSIPVASWSPGTYLLYLTDKSGSLVEIRKLLIQ